MRCCTGVVGAHASTGSVLQVGCVCLNAVAVGGCAQLELCDASQGPACCADHLVLCAAGPFVAVGRCWLGGAVAVGMVGVIV